MRLNFILLFFLSLNFVFGQDIDKSTYKLIEDIISKDTILTANQSLSLADKVKSGQLSKSDSIKYGQAITNKKCLLFKFKSNSKAVELLTDDLLSNGLVSLTLTTDSVRKIISKFPSDREHNFNKISDVIESLGHEEKWMEYHKFSSPVNVDSNKYLIYHFHSKGLRNASMEFLLYSICPSGKYKIEKTLGILYH